MHHENGKNDHRMPQNDDAAIEDIFKPKHEIRFTENNLFTTFLEKDRSQLIHYTAKALTNWEEARLLKPIQRTALLRP